MLNICEPVCNRDVSTCLWQCNTHHASNSIFSGTTLWDCICLMARITNQWYVRNHFISNVFLKTKLFSFNISTVTFFLCTGKLLPQGVPIFALNWDLVSSILYTNNHTISSTATLLIWLVFVPLWYGRGRMGKKVTAVIFSVVPPW